MTNLEILGMMFLIWLLAFPLMYFLNWISIKNSIKIMRILREKYLDRCYEMDIDPDVIPEEFEFLEKRMPTLKDSMSVYSKYGGLEYDRDSFFKIKSRLKIKDLVKVPSMYKKRAFADIKLYSFLFKRKYRILNDEEINRAAFHAKLFLILVQMILVAMLMSFFWLSQNAS